ncbi:MAG: hypothetical protein U1E29_08010, partial [Coriobacteriia bacterium]|nr:hypothetical protein [Coriobacteriia bacterium]
NFIVDLPDTPQVCAESGHATVITEYVCDNDEAIVRVGVTEHRRGFIDAVGAPALLEQYRVVLSDVWQGYTINFDDGGEFLGYPAVRTTMLSDDGTAAVYCLVVITDRYEYELVAESFDELDGDGTGQERFHRLFESFQFVEGP